MNMSIECEVTECRYNNKREKYCMLNKIKVEKATNKISGVTELADCSSFEKED